MAETSPRDDFLAESLSNHNEPLPEGIWAVTYSSNLINVA